MGILNISKTEKVKIRAILNGYPITSVLTADISIINGNIITTAFIWIEQNPQQPAKTI